MSKFVDTLLASALESHRGMTTGEPHEPRRHPWSEVHAEALTASAALRVSDGAPGVRPGDAVAVLAADPAGIAPAAQAVWLAGGSVTMLHQPTARTELEEWARDTVTVLRMIDARLVLLGSPFEALADVLAEHGIAFRMLDRLAAEGAALGEVPVVHVDDDVTALLQLTSGSTAAPKAVRITHGNLYANMTGMTTAARLRRDDVMISWLPLFHDMGMVGFLTVPMALGLELVTVTPAEFLNSPLLWAELISRYGGTVTAAPNFAYAVLGRRLAGVDPDTDLQLDTMRFALNGAEPIDPSAVRTFVEAGARFGLDSRSMICAYGMAETTLGVSFAPIGRGLEVDVVDADELEHHRRAVPGGAHRTRAFPLLGLPLPGLEVVAVDDDGQVLGDREVGQLRVRGDSVTPGYLTVDGPVPTRDRAGWLDTGDEGYLVDGAVVVCGRRKDVIIVGGRNIFPTDIERAASSAAGVRAGNAVAVRVEHPDRRESFAVAVESARAGDEAAEQLMRREVTARVVDAVGVRPRAVVVLPPASLPKTPSGKLRRSAARERIDALLG